MSLPANDSEIALRIVAAEGGKVNNPADPGGATNYGITMRTLVRVRPGSTLQDLWALTPASAAAIYLSAFIAPFSAILDPVLRWVVADAGVNASPLLARQLLQRALGVKDDGVWGPLTLHALYQANQRKLAIRVCTMRQRFYADITAGNLSDRDHNGVPDDLQFIRGWTNRTMDMIEELTA